MTEHILHGVPELDPIPNDSLGQYVFKSLLKGDSKIAMIDAVTGEEITYSDIRIKTLIVAQYFKNFGLRKNDVISISAPNCLDFFIPAIAAIYIGVAVAPINYSYVPREMVHTMNISKPKIVICTTDVLDKIMVAAKDIPSVKKIIVFEDDSNIKEVESLKDILKSNKYLSSFQIEPVEPDHVSSIMCSSGTTGLPKGVMLTHQNIIVSSRHLGRPDYGQLNSSKITIALLPFFHAYGFVMHLCQMILHVKMVVLPKFEEKLFLSSIEKHKATTLFLVPPLMVFLAKSPMVSKYDLSSVQEVTSGAAPLGKEVQDLIKKRLNISILRQGYGMTETTLAVLMQPANKVKLGTSGILSPGMSCKVIEPDTGKTMGSHMEGELCFKGPLIMKQYCGDVQATSATIDEQGWLHTGDLGYYDEEGYFYIVDRLKELIKYKGFQVPPAELEAILVKNPKVRDAAVIGVPDENCGELALGFVVKVPDSNITEQEIMKYVEDNVSYHKRLHGGVRFVSEIPKNPSGKILRRLLRDSLKIKAKF